MQRRAPITDEAEHILAEDIIFAGIAKVAKGAILGLWELSAGLAFACSIPFARDANEREWLYESCKVKLVQGGVTTAMWVVPAYLMTTIGGARAIYATGLVVGVVHGGIAMVKVVRNMTAAHTHAEPILSSTEQVFREIGHRRDVAVTPDVTLTPASTDIQAPAKKPKPEEELQFKLEM